MLAFFVKKVSWKNGGCKKKLLKFHKLHQRRPKYLLGWKARVFSMAESFLVSKMSWALVYIDQLKWKPLDSSDEEYSKIYLRSWHDLEELSILNKIIRIRN